MLKFKDFANTPEYQQADPATRLEMRRAYFDTQIRPRVPARNVETQWQQFDQATGELGDPTQGYFGDTVDALQQGLYSGVGDLASGVDYMVGGDGENAVADYFRGKADEQWQEMSPSGREAMQGFGVEEKPDSFTGYGLKDTSTKGGFGLQLAAAAGSFGPSIIPGGIAARGLSWGAKGKRAFDLADKAKKIETVDDARRLKKLNDRIDQTAFATGYGATGGAMIGGGAAEQTKQLVLSAGYEDLKDLPRFQALYRQEYEAAGGGDTRAPFDRARELLAAEAAREAFAPAAGVGAVSMGVAGPLLDKIGRGLGASGRISNAGKGTVVEGAQEFTEGAGQQIASNLGQQSIGMDVDTTQGAMAEGLSGAIVGGPVGGAVGGVPTPQGRPDQGKLQQTLTDLHSQRQTLQEQMNQPDADRAVLTGLLRKNAIATAQAESQLQSRQPIKSRQEIPLGKAVDLPPEVQPQTPLAIEHQPQPYYTDSQGNTGTDPQQLRTERTRQQHPGYPQYTGQEDQDLQTYTGRVSGLKKVLRDFQWKPEDKAKRQQLRKIIDERRKLEKQSRELAARQQEDATNPALKGERERRQQAQPYTPVNIIEKLQAAKVAYDNNRMEDFNQAVAEIHAANSAEREKLQAAEYELSGKGLDSRATNPAYREYMGAVADEVDQNQIQQKRASLKLQDDDSLIPAIGKLGGLDLASVEDTIAESMDAHIKSNKLGLKGKYLKKNRGVTLDDMARQLAEVGYTIDGREMTANELSDAIAAEIAGRPVFSDARSDYGDLYQNQLEGTAGASNRTAPAIRAALNGEPLTGEQRNELARVLESAEVDPNFDRPDYLSQEEAAIDQARQDNALTDDWYDRYEPEALSYADNETELNGEAFSERDWKEINEQRLLEDAAAHEQELNYEERPDDNRRTGQSLRQSSQRMGEENRQKRPESEEQSSGVSGQEAEKELTSSETPVTDSDSGQVAPVSDKKAEPAASTPPEKGADNTEKTDDKKDSTERTPPAKQKTITSSAENPVKKNQKKTVKTLDKESDTQSEKFDDFGEQLGGARKDLSGGRAASRNKNKSSSGNKDTKKPGYYRHYEIGESVTGKDKGKWVLRRDSSKRKTPWSSRTVGTFNTREEAEEAIPLYEVSIKHRVREQPKDSGQWEIYRQVTDRKSFPVKKGFSSRDEAMRWMVENADEVISFKTALGDEIRPNLESVDRRGTPHRKGNVKPEDFQKTFGFYAGQFGNWNTSGDRQADLNYAYDALMDLAEVLNLPPKALSLNGELAIAFGARGQGLSGAKAHYERTYGVINLTRMNGAGSLAHEWMHALDHYFGRQDGKAKPAKENPGKGERFEAGKREHDYVSHGFGWKSEVREQVREKWQGLMDTLTRTTEEYLEDGKQYKRTLEGRNLGITKSLKDIRPLLEADYTDSSYDWKKRHRKPATKAQLAEFDKLAATLEKAVSDNQRIPIEWAERTHAKKPGFTNDTLNSIAGLLKKVRGQSGWSEKGYINYLASRINWRNGSLDQYLAVEKEARRTRKRPTDYVANSQLIDQGRTGDYWATRHELLARAFEAYIFDRIHDNGLASDYLAYGVTNDHYRLFGVKPYPEGQERTRFSAAFDELFKTLKHRKTDKGTQLYRYRDNKNAKGLKRDPLRLKLAPLAKKLGVPVQVLQSESQLPLDLYRDVRRDKAEGRVRGLYDPKTAQAFVVADNLDSVEDAARTVLHEVVGHHGVRQVAGKRLDTLLDQLHRDMSDGLKKALAKRYKDQLKGQDKTTANRIIAEEYLAHLAERNPQNTWVQKVYAIIRNAFRRLMPSIQWRPEDAVELLAAGRRHLKRSRQKSTGREPRYRDSGQADPFYSAVERAAAAVKHEKAPGKSWLNAIKKMPHVTDEEIQWMGLDLYLNNQKGSVTRDQVLDYIRANRIEVKEVKYGVVDKERDEAEKPYREQWIKDASEDMGFGDYIPPGAWNELLDEHRNKLWESNRDYYEESLREELNAGTHEDQDHYMDEDGNINDDAVYRYAADQADFYNEDMSNEEAFKSVPEEERQSYAEELYDLYGFDEFESQYLDKHETRYKNYSTDGGDEYQELLFTLPDHERWYPRRVDVDNEYDLTAWELKQLKAGKKPGSIDIKEGVGGWYLNKRVYIENPEDSWDTQPPAYTHKLTKNFPTREEAIADAIEQAEAPYRKALPAYRSGHWDERNILAHTRFQTFYDQDKNKVLLIDEIQSDWHQEARDRGYQSLDHDDQIAAAQSAEITAMQEHTIMVGRHEAAKARQRDATEALDKAKDTYELAKKQTNNRPTASLELLRQDYLDAQARLEKARQTVKEVEEKEKDAFFKERDKKGVLSTLKRQITDAPLKENWPNMVMKRLLRHAAENGFDKVAWTTGTQQTERYGTGSHLSEVRVTPLFNESLEIHETGKHEIGGYDIEIIEHNGTRNRIPSQEAGLIEDAVGSRLADIIRNQSEDMQFALEQELKEWSIEKDADIEDRFYVIDPNGEYVYDQGGTLMQFASKDDAYVFIGQSVYSSDNVDALEFRDLDEVVGGDGMAAFYDNRLVNYVKKYTKKWGGKVGKVELETDDGDQVFWSVPVTDKMKESVMRHGQPLFALRKREQKTFKQRLATVLKAKNRVNPLVVSKTPDVLQLFGERNKNLTLAKRVITKSTKKDHKVPMEVIEQLPELLSDPELVFTGSKDRSYSLVVRAWEGDKQVMVAVNVKGSTIDSIHGRTKEQYSRYVKDGELLYYKNENSLKMIGESEKSLSRSDKYAPDALVQFQGEAQRLPDSRRKVANYQSLIKFRAKKSEDNTRYALKSDLPDEVEKVMNAIHGGVGKRRKGWSDRVKDWLKEHPSVGTKRGWKQGILDSFHSIAEMERDANMGKLMEAALSAWKAALRTKNLEGVMTAVLGKGTPKLDNGSVVFRENSKGFLEIFEPVAEKGEIELWETWAASKRAMRLLKEGRENLYTPQRIKTIQTYVASMPGMEQRFQKVFDDYQTFNSQVLDFAEQAGLIDKEARKLWDTGDYIPFHRVHEVAEGEGEQMRLFRKSGLSGQKSGIKKLTGGVEKISPLEAMFRNTQSLIDASFKNIAMQRIAKLGEETGAIEKTNASVRLSAEDVKAKLKELEVDTNALSPEALKRWQKLLVKFTDLGEGTVTVSEDGQTASYQVHDPLLLAAITDLGTQNIHWMLKLLSIPKQVLTQLVTADPGFMVRNLFRDTLSTWMTVHPEINGKALKVNPVSAAIRTFNKKIDEDDTRWSLMMAGGGSGGFYDIQPDNIRKKLSPEEQKRIINKPGQLWDAWQKFGSRFENANRLHVFEQVIKQGGSVAEAAHQAQDVLNFTRKGQWQIMNILVQSLPFFNARVQGLDRLWRGAKADGKSGWAGIAPSFLLRGAAYMSASLGLLALYDDDERYTSLPEWDKLNYHHVWFDDVHYRIPKPFEVGAIFGTLPEMIWQTSMGHEDLKWVKKMAGGMIFQTLAFDPVPQVARPALDIATNKNSFTDSPIIPLGLQYVKPEAQYDPWTSETMKQLVKAVPEGAPDWMRSPKKLQYLLQGYFGTIGRYALAATDIGTRMAVDAPVRPALRARDLPVAGSFIRDGVDATRYRTEMYEMQKELNDLVMTMNRYRDNGQRDKARKLKEENREKLTARRGLNRYVTRISRLRKQIRKIMDNRVMTARVKRDKIDALSRRVNQLSAEAVRKYGDRF